ncbi:MAG: hypothetical protein KIG44_05105 [Eubacteriales bacterium]|nr:hypothetical protein [Eubacteriales bacterium]
MKKSLYSLMLSDEVVREIDVAAHRLGTNRSALINRILAEYASVTTPEKRINDIFSSICNFFGGGSDIVPLAVPNQDTMLLKSSLKFKYRPTVRYEVELRSTSEGTSGKLSVVIRTQSPALSDVVDGFFVWMKRTEEKYLPAPPEYEFLSGRYVRSINPMGRIKNGEELSLAISSYVAVLDRLLKGCVSGELDAETAEKMYVSYLNNTKSII